MNLFELLKNYKSTPSNEIRKIKQVLSQEEFVYSHYKSFEDVFKETFPLSAFSSYESSFSEFVRFIFQDSDEEADSPELLISYRYFCEMLIELMSIALKDGKNSAFGQEFTHLSKIIKEGLRSMNYSLVKKNGHIVTQKNDETAEAIAVTNEEYEDSIFQYLIAKTIVEKETALTNLSIKLEASKPKSGIAKDAREWIQLFRHKDEKRKDPHYSWFFHSQNYDQELDKLFKIILGMIACDDSIDYLNEYQSRRGVKI